ncbi:MAG: tRNA (adenosine(37)-N6)-threonylcarbamoyltransferase complex transferase subunit TsaD [Candidatus Pacebacteria bacterium]|nr:tRNA (adenosine(37)-N6)-threonylcarbamoyltransferase complex transferase subunit TsaD [Candidatus Paceibacterota bacterium]
MPKNNQQPPLILSIDTSCDETAAAVTLGRVVLSNIIASQAEIHSEYGGVFPDLAKLAHQENIEPVIAAALKRAGISWEQLDALAVTIGPGLAPALEIGIEAAVNFSQKFNKPLIGVNHLEAHLLSILASRNKRPFKIKQGQANTKNKTKIKEKSLRIPEWKLKQLNQADFFPALGLIVSGGHSEFVLIKKIGQYQVLGQTVDDAAGEALDKVGRMINLGYPAGPVLEKLAKKGNPAAFDFPLPMTTIKNYNLSYSGLKTAALRQVRLLENNNQLNRQAVFDFAASFQQIVVRHLTYKLKSLLSDLQPQYQFTQLWLGGGVAANLELRKQLRQTLKLFSIKLHTPFEKRLCGDNAAMIGIAAGFKHQANLSLTPDQTDRRPNWSVEQSWEI